MTCDVTSNLCPLCQQGATSVCTFALCMGEGHPVQFFTGECGGKIVPARSLAGCNCVLQIACEVLQQIVVFFPALLSPQRVNICSIVIITMTLMIVLPQLWGRHLDSILFSNQLMGSRRDKRSRCAKSFIVCGCYRVQLRSSVATRDYKPSTCCIRMLPFRARTRHLFFQSPNPHITTSKPSQHNTPQRRHSRR